MAKKKSTFGKLVAFTTVAAAIGGTCYIFRDKIKSCPLYQRMSSMLADLCSNKKNNFTFGAGVRGKQSFKKRKVTRV